MPGTLPEPFNLWYIFPQSSFHTVFPVKRALRPFALRGKSVLRVTSMSDFLKLTTSLTRSQLEYPSVNKSLCFRFVVISSRFNTSDLAKI
jgi:hypothetical protein